MDTKCESGLLIWFSLLITLAATLGLTLDVTHVVLVLAKNLPWKYFDRVSQVTDSVSVNTVSCECQLTCANTVQSKWRGKTEFKPILLKLKYMTQADIKLLLCLTNSMLCFPLWGHLALQKQSFVRWAFWQVTNCWLTSATYVINNKPQIKWLGNWFGSEAVNLNEGCWGYRHWSAMEIIQHQSLEIRLVWEISAQHFSSQNSFLAIITEISKCDDEGDLQAVITAAQWTELMHWCPWSNAIAVASRSDALTFSKHHHPILQSQVVFCSYLI